MGLFPPECTPDFFDFVLVIKKLFFWRKYFCQTQNFLAVPNPSSFWNLASYSCHACHSNIFFEVAPVSLSIPI